MNKEPMECVDFTGGKELFEEPMEWEEEFMRRAFKGNFGLEFADGKKTACVNFDKIIEFIKNEVVKNERERIIKLIKEKGLHLGYKNHIINLISSENK